MASSNRTKTTSAQKRKRKKATAEERRLAAQRAARKAKLQWAAVVLVGVGIVGAIVGASVWDARPRTGDTSRSAWDLPARDNDADGDGRIELADFEGRPTVVNFYADWCTACESELPDFATVSADLSDEVNFVHVNSQETGDWKRLMDLGTGWWPIARDINGQQSGGSGLYESVLLPGVRGMPVTAFYDASGRHVDTTGFLDEPTLRRLIEGHFGVS